MQKSIKKYRCIEKQDKITTKLLYMNQPKQIGQNSSFEATTSIIQIKNFNSFTL